MFDFDSIACELPSGYTFEFDKGDDMYVLSFGGQEIGGFYHHLEMVEAGVSHKELAEWKVANSHLF